MLPQHTSIQEQGNQIHFSHFVRLRWSSNGLHSKQWGSTYCCTTSQYRSLSHTQSLSPSHFHLLATAFHIGLGLIGTQRSPRKGDDLKTKQNIIFNIVSTFLTSSLPWGTHHDRHGRFLMQMCVCVRNIYHPFHGTPLKKSDKQA